MCDFINHISWINPGWALTSSAQSACLWELVERYVHPPSLVSENLEGFNETCEKKVLLFYLEDDGWFILTNRLHFQPRESQSKYENSTFAGKYLKSF